MACYRPVSAWRILATDEVFFGAEPPGARPLSLPCGYCLGCRLDRSRAWAVRCMHEASLHKASSFVTLTYDQDHYRPSLNYRDFQLFAKALRRNQGPFRYFVCGEYGSQNNRPHFHALLFGVAFPELKPISKTLYRSRALEQLWTSGFSSIGAVTHASAAYVARYSIPKVYGRAAAAHYRRVDLASGELVDVVPEFAHMSLKPGIGHDWIYNNMAEVYGARDAVVLAKGRTVRPPRYYDELRSRYASHMDDELEYERYLRSNPSESTPERLAVRERVAAANLKFRATRSL